MICFVCFTIGTSFEYNPYPGAETQKNSLSIKNLVSLRSPSVHYIYATINMLIVAQMASVLHLHLI